MADNAGLSKRAFVWFGLHAEALDGGMVHNLTMKRFPDDVFSIRGRLDFDGQQHYFVGMGVGMHRAAEHWLQQAYRMHGLGEPPQGVKPLRE